MFRKIIPFIICFFAFAHNMTQIVAKEIPVIFNRSETAGPGKVFGLQGSAFGEKPEVMYCVVQGKEKTLKPAGTLNVVTGSEMNISVAAPEDIKEGSLIAVWVKDGGRISEPVLINQARIVTVEYDEITPGGTFRVFGRNLSFPGRKPEIVLQEFPSGSAIPAEVIRYEPYIITIKAPEKIQPGKQYRIRVSNGAGGKWGETFAEERIKVRPKSDDPFRIGVPWAGEFTFHKNIYNIRNDSRLKLKAKGDGLVNDKEAIQQAIDKANADGGGVVYLPKGKYRIEIPSGSGLEMKSNVVLKGDGPEQTIVQYGYGTLPDEPGMTDGVAILWQTGTHHTGLIDFTLQNVETEGTWRHSLRTMPLEEKKQGSGGTHYFAVNCRFDLSVVGGLMWFFVDHVAIVDCQFDSKPKGIWLTWPWMWHFDGVSNYVVRNNRVHYSAGRLGFNESYNGIIENNHITRYGDLQTEKGETGGFNIDYAKDIIVLANRMDVEGATIASKNQGETILSQGCNPPGQSLGLVSQATPTTIIDIQQKWPVLRTATIDPESNGKSVLPSISNIVAIISGKGRGQWRYIVKNDETTLHVHQPWDVVPDVGSQYVVTEWSAEDWLIKDNILDNNHQGIMLYCGGTDVAITGNKQTNSGGIYLRSDQRVESTRYNLTWNVSVTDNRVINTNGLRSAHVAMYHVKVTGDNSEILGTGTIGVEMRRNLVQASVPNVNKPGGSSGLGAEGYFNCVICGNADKTPCDLSKIAILGTIMEDNIAINTENAYHISAGAYNTVIVPGKMENVPDFMKEQNGKAQNSYIEFNTDKHKSKK